MLSDLKNIPDFLSAVALVAARIALKMTTERRQQFIEGDGRRQLEDGLSRYFEEPSDIPQLVVEPQYPAKNEKFQLTINGQTKWFMLVSVGYQPSWESLQAALAPHQVNLDAPWLDAFKKAFPKKDGKGPIGIAKASWVFPDGGARFPSVVTDDGVRFDWADFAFFAGWRWLVGVQA